VLIKSLKSLLEITAFSVV